MVDAAGWVSPDPDIGTETAVLMFNPHKNGHARTMRAFAELLGYDVADSPAPMPQLSDTVITVGKQGHLKLFSAERFIVEFTMSQDWVRLAEESQFVVVMIGLDGFTGRPEDLPRYAQRDGRFHTAGITVRRDTDKDSIGLLRMVEPWAEDERYFSGISTFGWVPQTLTLALKPPWCYSILTRTGMPTRCESSQRRSGMTSQAPKTGCRSLPTR